jgi:tRNA threonylcarbamoyladenosine biosynthesis protein TsaE
MAETHVELLLTDSNAPEALGSALARAYQKSGGGSAVLYLHGELGAGKTTCARSLLRALGVVGAIRSPTYTLVEAYPMSWVTCVHVDLYRVRGPVEVDELGLRDYFDEPCLLLVEWPDRGGDGLPAADVDMTLCYAGEARSARLYGASSRGQEWLTTLRMTTA